MIGVLKSKGVPVLWVGLPAIRGPKGTADMLFLDALYRDAAGKAGITYVDVWDGFVDEAGRFLQKGPDFEGQIRQLRTFDGVFFTKARRAQARALCRARGDPPARRALRADRAADRTCDARRQCRSRPAGAASAGRTVLPLVASSVGTDQLLGGPGSRPAAVDALAARTLVKGEALAAPAGRADDFAWPRREIGREQAKGDTPVAATSPSGTVAATPAEATVASAATASAATEKPFRPAQTEQPSLPPRPAAFAARLLRWLRHGAAPAAPPAPPPRPMSCAAPAG